MLTPRNGAVALLLSSLLFCAAGRAQQPSPPAPAQATPAGAKPKTKPTPDNDKHGALLETIRANPPAPAKVTQPAGDKNTQGATAAQTAPNAAAPGQDAAPDKPRPDKPDGRNIHMSLAPTPADLQRQRAARDRKADNQKDEARASRGRLPTQLGNTAGPKGPNGAGTVQDRKAATVEASDPAPFYRN